MIRSHNVFARFILVGACSFAALFASCGFNLDPAWFVARTSVSVTFSGTADEGLGRAISTDSGFLYLQTDLTPDSAKTYGPYPVSSGSSVTVTDIPAGSYSGMILLFVPSELSASLSVIVPGGLTTECARLAAQACFKDNPDACYEASVALIPDVEIKEGANNALGATLVPITDLTPDYVDETNGCSTFNFGGETVKTIRRFMRLDGMAGRYSYAEASAVKTMTMTLHNSAEMDPLTISSVGLYDSTGARVLRRAESITLLAGNEMPYTVNWSGDDVYYAYVEYTGKNLSCTFSNSTIESTLLATVTFDWNVPSLSSQTLENYTAGVMVSLPTCPATYPGYVFKGWAKSKEATTPDYPMDSERSFDAGALTLYAVWEAASTLYIVTFDLNGGTGDFSSATGTYGSTINLPADAPTRTKYTFLGWALDKDQKWSDYTAGSTYLIPDMNVTLYAVWSSTTIYL